MLVRHDASCLLASHHLVLMILNQSKVRWNESVEEIHQALQGVRAVPVCRIRNSRVVFLDYLVLDSLLYQGENVRVLLTVAPRKKYKKEFSKSVQ